MARCPCFLPFALKLSHCLVRLTPSLCPSTLAPPHFTFANKQAHQRFDLKLSVPQNTKFFLETASLGVQFCFFLLTSYTEDFQVHFPMAFSNGVFQCHFQWHFQWHFTMTFFNGIFQWHLQCHFLLAFSNGIFNCILQWHFRTAFSNGIFKGTFQWHFSMAFFNGIFERNFQWHLPMAFSNGIFQ